MKNGEPRPSPENRPDHSDRTSKDKLSSDKKTFSETDFENLPPSTIPSLKDKATFIDWARSLETHGSKASDVWVYQGDRGYKKEFESLFEDKLLEYCKQVLASKKCLKIVSFGGGKLKALLELREMLNSQDIEIVDFSLTKDLGQLGIDEYGNPDDLSSGAVKLNAGPLEIRDVDDAEDADVMISVSGPFYHAGVNKQILIELVEKAVNKLAPGGRAFLEAMSIGLPTEESQALLEILERDLGDNFVISSGHNSGFNSGYLDITHKSARP